MSSEAARFVRIAVRFVLVGVVLYLAVYAVAEWLNYAHTHHNRFYMIKTAPHSAYDVVILGASHAAVFDLEDMTATLERMTRAKILNLATVGGGVVVNRLLLDYFLVAHRTNAVVYVVDSFAFYSPAWNEGRLQDVQLFNRAPFDPVLGSLLLRNRSSRAIALDYVSGFSKINNPDRFRSDIQEEDLTRFHRTYRPVHQIDTQRLEYLYPGDAHGARSKRDQYLASFEALIQHARSNGARFVAVKPPLPERVYRMLPDEADFNAALKVVLDRSGVHLHDFSLVGNDEKFYSDTDHLNRTGVLHFFENYLSEVLIETLQNR